MTSENLEIIKNFAIQLLYLDAIPTGTIGGIQQVSHPVFDENGCCPHCGLKPVPEGAKILTKERQRALYNQIKPLLDEAEQSMRIIEQQRSHAWTCYHELRLLLIGIC